MHFYNLGIKMLVVMKLHIHITNKLGKESLVYLIEFKYYQYDCSGRY